MLHHEESPEKPQYNMATPLRPQPATLLKKETLIQVFSCEFCEISKNNFSYRTPLVAVSLLLEV